MLQKTVTSNICTGYNIMRLLFGLYKYKFLVHVVEEKSWIYDYELVRDYFHDFGILKKLKLTFYNFACPRSSSRKDGLFLGLLLATGKNSIGAKSAFLPSTVLPLLFGICRSECALLVRQYFTLYTPVLCCWDQDWYWGEDRHTFYVLYGAHTFWK